MDWLWWLVGICIVLGVGIGVWQISNAGRIRQGLLAELGEGADVFVSESDFSFVGLPRSSDFVLIGRGSRRLKYPIEVISTVEILRNDVVITATNRGSQALGAAVGGLAFGGVGAVVGALTGTRRGTGNVRRVSLRIVVDDRDEPFHEVTFFTSPNEKKGSDPEGILAKTQIGVADRFHALLIGAMRKVEMSRKGRNPISTTVQLKELWALKEQGVLTLEEFEQEKARVLRGPP